MRWRHLFGPVPSRRLGVSLGIDLTPERSCTLNCVYCECGRTEELTLARRAYVPTEEVIAELRAYLSEGPALDSITFSGSGEPTMHTGIGEIIAMLRAEYPQYAVTVLTNSSLLHLAEVRAALLPATRVVPSLDAVSDGAFLKINRPVKGLTNAMVLEGLRRFASEYRGELWLEVFLVPGVNDSDEELALLRAEVDRLGATRVQINTLDRPGAVSWITPASSARLHHAAAMLGPRAEVVSRHGAGGAAAVVGDDELRARILATVLVRPSTVDDLVEAMGAARDAVTGVLDDLLGEERVITRREDRGVFYVGRKG